jgi:hypothetical protein
MPFFIELMVRQLSANLCSGHLKLLHAKLVTPQALDAKIAKERFKILYVLCGSA